MSEERHERLAHLFERACDLSPEDQVRFLEAECVDDRALLEELRVLLAADAAGAGSGLETPAAQHMRPDLSAAESEPTPERIGSYRVLRRLGRGGMGVVYEAEQENPRRRVALKVLRADCVGPEALRRFEREARVLGWLRHPGIAQVYEAGTARTELGDQAFLAMELVEGQPLGAHVSSKDLNDRARLALVASLCDAVHHAHQKGVIHRDLKPANILVEADGRPKILDFGIARATDADLQMTTQRTAHGELIGTLAYMSPEQVAADPSQLDTRSDVYALGVIAYELLAGRLPHDFESRAVPQAVRAILEDSPTRLGRRRASLAGDVETIVGKALEKDPERRYGSAEELAADIRRYLALEPIRARAPSTLYQLRKFARRNRVLVGGVAAVILSLVAGIVFTTREYQRAERAGRLAEEEALRARESAGALREANQAFLEILSAPSPYEDGADVRLIDVLEDAEARLDGKLEQHPAQRAWLLHSVAGTFAGLGRGERAEPLVREALELALREPSTDPFLIAGLHLQLANLLVLRNETEESLELALEARRRYAALDPARPGQVAQTYLLEVQTASARGAWDEAVELARRTLERAVAFEASDPVLAAEAHHALAKALLRSGELPEAEARAREALARLADAGLAEAWETVLCTNTLASILTTRQEYAEAAQWMEKSLRDVLALGGEEHRYVAVQMSNLGLAQRGRGDLDRAEELLRRSLDISRGLPGEPQSERAVTAGNLASLLHHRGRLDEAEDLVREALELTAELSGPTSLDYAVPLGYLGAILLDRGRTGEGEQVLREALALKEALLPAEHPLLALDHRQLGMLCARRGEHAEAAAHFERLVAIQAAGPGPASRAYQLAVEQLEASRAAAR